MIRPVVFALALTLAADAFWQVNAETTVVPGNHTGNHTHHHHESNEIENFSFHYDGATQLLLVTAGTKCYIWTLTHKQQQSVHTDDGLRAIELKVLGDIDQALYTVVPGNILTGSIMHACGKQITSFYLVH